MIQPMDVTPAVSEALARLRQIAADGKIGVYAQIARDLDTLDNAGVFAEIDGRNEYAGPEEILADEAPLGTLGHLRPDGSTVVLTAAETGANGLPSAYTFTYRGEPYAAETEWEDGTGSWFVSYEGEQMAVRHQLEDAVNDALADVDQLSRLI
jgi:hypothetical protein